ncbi:MAG: D-alanyl-D-alanine carboxypeptidase/D-alanyl-D-alanine-endopeptidase, partial [Planctomycetota bacterium]|nr:D-alanyl-D-alanine carboxypeptidase/D-alanyl-D-alanine-endopeptidase [Planctomycetota bacterium]
SAHVRVAVHARILDPESGGTLAAIGSDRVMRPASNMKLVTTAAALVLLGADWSFTTDFEAEGSIEDDALRGDLVVRAAGDPLQDPDGEGRAEERLGRFARDLRARGIAEVTGDLVLDEGSFAVPAPAPGWPAASQLWTDYCALAGGFSVNGGVLHARAIPAAGKRFRVEVHPSPHGLKERYDVRAGKQLDVAVGATATTCTVRGQIPASKKDWAADFSHPDPVRLFGEVLFAQLEAAGVKVRGDIVRKRNVPGGEVLATLRSPLFATLVPINTHSINGVADQVFLALGDAVAGEGTRAGGQSAVVRALLRLGVPTAGFVQIDGSGLSRENRVSAHQIAALLEAVSGLDEATRDAFLGSLAVAGRTGTLADRMRETPSEGRVFAKTGWIAGTSALSGFARTADGRTVVFSILVEYPAAIGSLNNAVFKPMQDELVGFLVTDV